MRIQIIPSKDQKFLRDFFGCELWKIYEVIRVINRKSHHNCKVQKEWIEYEIEVIRTDDSNVKGQKTTINIKDDECIVV